MAGTTMLGKLIETATALKGCMEPRELFLQDLECRRVSELFDAVASAPEIQPVIEHVRVKSMRLMRKVIRARCSSVHSGMCGPSDIKCSS